MTATTNNRRKVVMTTCIRAAAMVIALGTLLLDPVAAQRPGGGGPNGRPEPLPLEASRKAEFTATEGTWISLDVSPDGQTIVFDLLGDLYTMPIEGGKATRITKGMAFDAQPRFSPDGETIAFVSDRSGGENLWTMRTDFTDTTQITRGNGSLYLSPEWMPDGEHVVVSRSSGLGGVAKIQMYNTDRRSPLPVIRGPTQLKTVGAAVTPDGRYIWYAGRFNDWTYNALFPLYQLYRYDQETGQSTLMTSRYGSGFRPAISPDGNWLVYGTRENTQTGLRKRNLTTGEEDWLAYPVQRDEMESRAPLDVLPGYSFTPDSRAVIVSYNGEIWRVPMDEGDATKIPLDVDVQLDIGPEVKFAFAMDTTEDVTARQIRHPVASPDGSKLLFTAFDRLWMKDMPNGEARRLTNGTVGEYHAAWSPDGQTIAFATWTDSLGGHINTLPVGGGPAQQLTSVPALYYNLAWSPDGQRIVATRAAARELKRAPDIFFGPLGGEFVWVPSAGGDVSLIAPTGGRDVAHFQSDNNDRIYAYSPREGLVSFRWDGTDVKQHLRVRGAPVPAFGNPHPDPWVQLPRRVFPTPMDDFLAADPAEQGPQAPPAGLVMMSPQGDRALAQVGSHIYTIDVPDVGGPVPTVSIANPAGAPVTVRKLTEVGGEFPAWSADGDRVQWAIGNALFTYDLDRVEAIEDSTVQATRDKVAQALVVRGIIDSLKATRKIIDSLKTADSSKTADFEAPDSLTNKLNGLIADSVQARADSIIREADDARAKANAIRELADSVRAGLDSVSTDSAAYKPDEVRIEVTMPRDVPSGTVVLRGGRILTMKDHEIIENGVVVITNNRITAVGPPDSVEVPDSARVIDVSGKTIIPGFVDTHYHAQWLVPEIHPEQTWQYLTNLAFGVTTTRDPQTASTDILSYQDRVETGGMIGPRIYSTGPGVFRPENIRDADHAKTVLQRYSKYYDTKTIKMYMTGNRQQRQWIIKAAKELELMPTTEGGLDFKLNLTHAIDGYSGIEHALPIAPIYQDVVELFKASQTTNSPTLLVSYGGPFGENFFFTRENVHDNAKLRQFAPHESVDAKTRRRGLGPGPGPGGWFLEEEYVFQKHAEFVRDLLADSARAAVGSHGQLQGLGYHWELWAMGSGGASNHDALRAATIYGAEAVGFGKDIGSIEPGKMADILVLNSDPLQNLRNTVDLQYVMKNGRIYDAETLAEVWPNQVAGPQPHWRNFGPSGVRAGIR